MSWTQEYNSVFFISLATMFVGLFGVSVKYCLRSKCEEFSLCCGLVKINRNVELEAQEEMKELELGVKEGEEKTNVPRLDLSKI